MSELSSKKPMNILIYGAGAIGSHIAYCMYMAGHAVNLVARGEHYNEIKKNGMHIKICDNEIVKHEQVIKENPKFCIVDNVDKIKDASMDYVFITVKLNDYNEKMFQHIHQFMDKEAAVIPPCTKLPFWWFYDLGGEFNGKYKNIDFNPKESKYFIRENIIGMTMWLSSVIESPGHVCVKHIQRGYPLKELHPNMRGHAERLRAVFRATCMSPVVDNIRSEIFIKSINSFAFNIVALDKELNNFYLRQNKDAQDSIIRIMEECEQIPRILNIPITQKIKDRVGQTLSSTQHTMSMLHDYRRGRPIELGELWGSIDAVRRILGLNLEYSKYMYDKVISKVNAKMRS